MRRTMLKHFKVRVHSPPRARRWVFAVLVGCLPQLAWAEDLICDRVIDDFSADAIGSWPSGWRERDGATPADALRHSRYLVEQAAGFKALRAAYGDKSVTIGRSVANWDLQRYPVLQWRWQAVQLPKGGDEARSGHNDTAASVYVFWKAPWPFRVSSLKFTWSTTRPVGAHSDRALGHYHVRVMDSGRANLGQWRTVNADVLTEATLRFGKDLEAPIGIAVLTDGDDTESPSEALYAQFRLCRRSAP